MFKFEYFDKDSGIYNSMELREEALTHCQVAERFTDFLRGCSYVFDQFAYLRLVDNEGNVLPTLEEKYRKVMDAAKERYGEEEDDYTFPVM